MVRLFKTPSACFRFPASDPRSRTRTYWITLRTCLSISILERQCTSWSRTVSTTAVQRDRMLSVGEWAATTTLWSSRSTPPHSSATSKNPMNKSANHTDASESVRAIMWFYLFIFCPVLNFLFLFNCQHNHCLHALLLAWWLLWLGEASVHMLQILQWNWGLLQCVRYIVI